MKFYNDSDVVILYYLIDIAPSVWCSHSLALKRFSWEKFSSKIIETARFCSNVQSEQNWFFWNFMKKLFLNWQKNTSGYYFFLFSVHFPQLSGVNISIAFPLVAGKTKDSPQLKRGQQQNQVFVNLLWPAPLQVLIPIYFFPPLSFLRFFFLLANNHVAHLRREEIFRICSITFIE